MNRDYLEKCFNKILEATKGDNTSDRDIIDYQNRISISKDDIENEYEHYLELQDKLDDYIEENNLDDTNKEDIKNIEETLPEIKNYLQYNQAVLIDFEDYMIKIIEEKLDNVRKANMIFNKNGNGFDTTKITIPVGWAKKLGFTRENKSGILILKDDEIVLRKDYKNEN